jgi:hypothetical protein
MRNNVDVSASIEALNARLDEYIKRSDQNIEHTREITNQQIEAHRRETEILVNSYKGKFGEG